MWLRILLMILPFSLKINIWYNIWLQITIHFPPTQYRETEAPYILWKFHDLFLLFSRIRRLCYVTPNCVAGIISNLIFRMLLVRKNRLRRKPKPQITSPPGEDRSQSHTNDIDRQTNNIQKRGKFPFFVFRKRGIFPFFELYNFS